MTTTSLQDEKKRLRAQIKEILSQLHFDRRRLADATLKNLLRLDSVQSATTIGVFIDFQNEIPTSLFLHELALARQDGTPIVIAAPYCLDRDMLFYRITPPITSRDGSLCFTNMIRNKYGVLEPDDKTRSNANALVSADEFDVMITPGLAFDRTGARLGRGAGYYDRYLPSLRRDALRVGLAFDEQLVAAVPHNANDQHVDVIVTPSQIIRARPCGIG